MSVIHLRNQSQQGDTLVEVLIAIVVVTTVLVAAYTTTTRNTNAQQDTQEHTQALQLASAQIEYLRSTALNGHQCFTPAGPNIGVPADTTSCTIDNSGTVPGVAQPIYTITITDSASLPSSPATYTVKVTWTGLDHSAQMNNVTLYYQH